MVTKYTIVGENKQRKSLTGLFRLYSIDKPLN